MEGGKRSGDHREQQMRYRDPVLTDEIIPAVVAPAQHLCGPAVVDS